MKAFIILAATAAVVGAASCSRHDSDDRSAAAPDIRVTPVKVDSVTLYRKFPGTLIAQASVNVVARVNGLITAKHYTSGDIVSKGQPLFSIESTAYADAVRQAEATLASARSNYDYATRRRAAMEKAFKSDAVSEMEVEQARDAEREGEASVKSAEAALSSARTNLGYCTVTSPIDGRVSDNNLSVGNYVSGEASPVVLCDVYDNENMLAVFSIEDIALAQTVRAALNNKNTRVPVDFGQKLPHTYTGQLIYLAPSMSNSTGTMTMQAEIANPYDELRPGMYVNVSVPVGVDPEAMLVRDASLSTDQLGKYLYTVNDSDRVVYTPVVAGDIVDDSMRIITSGISPSDRYVTSAMLKVRDGMTVHPFTK